MYEQDRVHVSANVIEEASDKSLKKKEKIKHVMTIILIYKKKKMP